MAQVVQTDTLLTAAEAQTVFDFTDPNEAAYLLNSLAAKARAWMGRVRLVYTGQPVVENYRGVESPTVYLHAAVDNSDFSANDLTVEHYSAGTLLTTYSAAAGELVVTTDDFSARVDLAAGSFPETCGPDFLRITYNGGWDPVPGDVFHGAILQGRVDLRRYKGEVGLINRSKGGESLEFDTHGVLRTVADIWRPYRVLV